MFALFSDRLSEEGLIVCCMDSRVVLGSYEGGISLHRCESCVMLNSSETDIECYIDRLFTVTRLACPPLRASALLESITTGRLNVLELNSILCAPHATGPLNVLESKSTLCVCSKILSYYLLASSLSSYIIVALLMEGSFVCLGLPIACLSLVHIFKAH